MTALQRSAAARSEQEIIDWLKEKPRTLGWDGWLAFGQETANRSLLEDNIARALGPDRMPPMEGKATWVDSRVWAHLYACRFDAPTISFEHSRLSLSTVTLSLRATSGTHLTVVSHEGEPKHVTLIETFHPVLGPALVGTVSLKHYADAQGGLHRVGFDLGGDVGDDTDYQFSIGDTVLAQRRYGRFLRDGFARLPEPQRHCAVTVLDTLDGGALAPVEVRARHARTRRPTGKRRRAAVHGGQGQPGGVASGR